MFLPHNAMDMTPDPSREKRNSVIVRAMMTTPRDGSSERRVRNLSCYGACIEHDGTLAEGMTVMLHMGTLHDLAGTVMWTTDRLAGLRFDEAIDLDAARRPRGVAVKPKAGWIADINDAYRRL